MTYRPDPIDTAGVKLSPRLNDLIERLAANNHDHWALKRIEEGWTFGPERNDKSKTHPDLIPYEELPDSEKEYDRRSVVETLKAMVTLGYSVEKTSKD